MGGRNPYPMGGCRGRWRLMRRGFREELSAPGYSARSAAGHLQLMALAGLVDELMGVHPLDVLSHSEL